MTTKIETIYTVDTSTKELMHEALELEYQLYQQYDRVNMTVNGKDEHRIICSNHCPRCIESYEDDEGNETKGTEEYSACSHCKVCKNCEHLSECELSN